MDSVFMIRNGGFGSNFEYKLLMALSGIIVCILDKKFKKRNDYFYVFLTGTIIWTLVEFLLQSIGTRNIEQAQLYGLEINLFTQALLQGMSEGAFIALIGIGFGDYILDKKSRKWGILGFIIYLVYIVLRVCSTSSEGKEVGRDVVSRRDMFTPAAIIFLSLMVVIDIIWYLKASNEDKKRGMIMVYILIIFASIWTIAEFLSNTRWIEMGSLDSLRRASPFVESFALIWDIVVEIALAYLPYFAIPSMIQKNY